MEELKTVTTHNQNDDVESANEDDKPMLSSQALAALQEFFDQQNQNQTLDTETAESESHTVALVSENWRLSQFWYDALTAETIANEVVSLCSNSGSRVACVACPTLYAYIKVILIIFFFWFICLFLELKWICLDRKLDRMWRRKF